MGAERPRTTSALNDGLMGRTMGCGLTGWMSENNTGLRLRAVAAGRRAGPAQGRRSSPSRRRIRRIPGPPTSARFLDRPAGIAGAASPAPTRRFARHVRSWTPWRVAPAPSDAEESDAEDPGAENSGAANSWAVITRASFLAPRFLGPRIAGAGCSRIVVVRAPGVANGTCPCPSAPPLDRMAGGDGPGECHLQARFAIFIPLGRCSTRRTRLKSNRTVGAPRPRDGPKIKRSTDGNRTG